MNDVELDRYYEDTFSLARTMVLKMEEVALRDNTVLTKAGFLVTSDKRTWRYYMNLSGEYHPTDDVMVILSLDTGEEIVFNRENLRFHIKTFREFSKGGYYFNRLMEAYPHQPNLIRGILSPIPFSETIEAKDYKILRYNASLVKWNEDQLIPKLQTFVNGLVPQLFKNDYITTDDLFLPLMIKELYADIIKGIHAIRIDDCYTRHTHEFFIWSHIDSFGNFSQYKNSLTNEQVMWLFRNIAWIKNNPGQQYTFIKLMGNLLTVGGIPLAKFDMVEATATQLEDLTPTPLYRKLQMNLVEEYGRAASFIDTEQMIYKQQPMAKDNYEQSAFYLDDALSKGKYSLHSELPTKVLESSMKDYTNRHADTLMSVVYNEWVYLAGNNMYQGKIITIDPKTGKQYRLPVKDAYNIWKYLVDFSKGEEVVYICPAYYQNVLKITPPTVAEIQDIGGPAFVDPKLAYDIRNLWFPVDIFIAPDYLIQYAFETYETMWKHKKLYSHFMDLNKRARVKQATKIMYQSGYVQMGTYTIYRDLLDAYQLDFSDYTAEECRAFAWDIFKRVTGWDANVQPSTRVKQSDLIDIMTQLSSYTIHVVKQIDDGTDSTEMYNEWFVGDSRWIGVGNGSYADLSNVMIDVKSNLDGIRELGSVTPLVDLERPMLKVETAGTATIVTGDILEAVNLPKLTLRDVAIKFPNSSYLRVITDTEVVTMELDPTYYGILDRDIEELPITYYGVLPHYEEDDDFQ